MRNLFARALPGVLLLLAVAACTDSPTEAGPPPGHARLALNAAVAATSASLVLEVTGPGIEVPLVFNLPVTDGVASGSVDVPVGSSRVFTGRLYDAGGTQTHRGETTMDVRPGVNAAISLRLDPLGGQQPIDVVISSYTIELLPVSVAVVGRPLQMRAVVRDADRNPVPDASVVWAVTQPTVARITSTGMLEFTAAGTTGVVALAGGVAASGNVKGLSLAKFSEYLIGSSFQRWWQAEAEFGTVGFMLSAQSFQHSALPNNWGMYLYSEYPRTAILNETTGLYYTDWSNPWTLSYQGIAALREARTGLGTWPDARYAAFAEFLLGLHLGNVALLYDQGLVIDETQDPATAPLRPYTEVMAAALAHLDQAIAHTQGGSFEIPSAWAGETYITSDQLRQLAYSVKARFRANVARTPAERAAVEWTQVISDADKGITSDFTPVVDDVTYHNGSLLTTTQGGFSQLGYQYLGMADQSGKYQAWISLPTASRHPVLPSGEPFTIVTPDNRFPRGTTIEAQRANPGRYYQATASTSWYRPERGTYRWSYYGDERFRLWREGRFGTMLPWFPHTELDMLRAEGHYRTGNLAQAAQQVNATRVAAGLNATDAAGLNTSCVPRLADGSCGGLFEMLKWEFRLETQFQGMFGAPWYFLGRGWGDLYRGTQLQYPVPCGVLQARGQACYTFGGVGGSSASPGSTYAWPFE